MASLDLDQPFAGLEFRWIERERLFVDETYQRLHIRHKHVGNIVKTWTPDHFGALNVAPRPDGLYAVIDGQHRLLALDQMGIRPTSKVPCIVHSTANEPLTFVHLNRRAILDPMEEFRASLEGEEPDAIELQRAVMQAGFEVALTTVSTASKRRDRSLYCIKRLQKLVADYGGPALTELLRFVDDTWPHDKDALTSHILGGLAAFRDIYVRMYDPAILVQALQTAGPRNILRDAREVASTGGGANSSVLMQVVRSIRKVYMQAGGVRLPEPERILRDRARAGRQLVSTEVPLYHYPQEQGASQ